MVEIWKLVPGSQAGPSRPPLSSRAATPLKEKPLVELKIPLSQHLMQELVAEVAKIKISAAPAFAKTKRESRTPKTTSFEPSSQRRMKTRKTKKEPTAELELEEEEAESSKEVKSSGEDLELEEEAKPVTPLLEKKKKMET